MYNIGNYFPVQNGPFVNQPIFTANPLNTRIFALFCTIFLTSNNVFAASVPYYQKRLEGGPDITWKPNKLDTLPKFGPFLSSEMKCHLNPTSSFACSTEFKGLNTYAELAALEIPTAILPYVDAVKNLSPFREVSTARFPEKFEAFVFNEIGLVGNGNRGCVLKKDIKVYPKCKKAADGVVEYLESSPMKSEVYDEEGFRSKGFGLSWGFEGEESTHVLVNINPQNSRNYRTAMDKMAEEFLGKDCFFSQSEESISLFINEIHELLMYSLEPIQGHEDILPGKFRTEKVIVFKPIKNEKGADPGRSLKALSAYLKEKGATSKELKNFASGYKKMGKSGNEEISFTPQEAAIINKIAFLAPPPNEIEAKMKTFISNFKKYAQQDIHPVALAAWVHCEIGRIHPFGDGNGRLARLFLNAILVRGGFKPVIFTDDDIYTDALFKDQEHPGEFAAYLGQLITKQASIG